MTQSYTQSNARVSSALDRMLSFSCDTSSLTASLSNLLDSSLVLSSKQIKTTK